MVVTDLMGVYTKFSEIADEHSGIPAYAHGDPNVGGGGSTASGLSMLMSSAARGIRGLIRYIDKNIIKPSVTKQYYDCIAKEDNFTLICDFQVVSSGSSAALVKEQLAARRLEFMQATANPIDAQIMGIEGRKYMLTETAKSLSMDLSRVIPPTPPPMQAPQALEPNEGAQTLDQAGNPVVGQDTRQFNQK
jgi:hypothetical protein